MKLVIVESPAKAKTIERFLGSDYRVVASYGHIRDLPSSASEIPTNLRSKSWARLAVDTEKDFAPVYVVPKESAKRVKELRDMVRDAEELILATDEDREGESISWHLLEVLTPEVPVRRITFHEITRGAIQHALTEPRDVDRKLVRAQEARRVVDRLFGYSLSPVLWKKVRTKLSAGRVQSAALRLIVEREEERQAFRSSVYWDVEATIGSEDQSFAASLVQIGPKSLATGKDFDSSTGLLVEGADVLVLDEDAATRIAEEARHAVPWSVRRVEHKETIQRPPPPFITSTLQQAASSGLGMTPKRTMALAQRLYEGIDLGGGDREGLITYMRTDSVTLSQKALDDAGTFIRSEFGEEYHTGPRRYRTKSRTAQEAHEAIRPSEMGRVPESVARFLEKDELALYRLIWSRAVASQMADARVDRTTVDFEASLDGTPHTFRANGSVLRFPGFRRISGGDRRDVLLPALAEGEAVGGDDSPVGILEIGPERHETRPPPRYTEASLVKKLEEEGIGRPSTYTPTISTIQDREYVLKKSGSLVPTYIGMAVTHLLRRHFPHYVDLKFTAYMEDALDDIATGEVEHVQFLSEFYRGDGDSEGLVNRIDEELPKIEFPAIPVGKDPETGQSVFVRIGRNYVYVQRGEGDEGDRATLPVGLLIDELTPEKASELIDARSRSDDPIGVDDETGLNIYAKTGPYGPYLQLGEGSETEKPKRVSLPRERSLADIDLEYARRMLALPRTVGVDSATEKPVTAGVGKYGPYVERSRQYRNLQSEDQIFEITLEQAIELLDTKPGKTVLAVVGDHPDSGVPLQVFDGRYGPYVSDGKLNASIPKGRAPDSIAVAEALELLAAAAERKGKKRRTSKRR